MCQVKTCFDCKMFFFFYKKALSVSPKGALEISSVDGQPSSLDRNHFSTPRMVAESQKHDERCRLHPKDNSIQLFTDASNKGWGAHLEQTSTKGLWSNREKRLHINILELKAVSLAVRSFKEQCQNQSVLVAMDNSTVVKRICQKWFTCHVDLFAACLNHKLPL